ncbi:hypothetical protein BDV06DRAFT_205701 [Aspergillus oleicola]
MLWSFRLLRFLRLTNITRTMLGTRFRLLKTILKRTPPIETRSVRNPNMIVRAGLCVAYLFILVPFILTT